MSTTRTLDSAVVKAHARDVGFDLVGVTRLAPSEHADFYRQWLAAGHHGDMHYLARTDAVERRLDPAAGWPGTVSAVVVGLNYYTADEDDDVAGDALRTSSHPGQGRGPERGVIARYARGRDYHKVIKRMLLELLRRIEHDAGRPLPLARAYVDTGPVLERELARRAGLGWFGRSTMLINPRRGSYFFLGTLLLDIELEPDAAFVEDRCGTCDACVAGCPTGALLGRDATGAPVIDARRCISYLTIENRGPIPHELRPLIGNRIFGCDICQEVCPWNSPKFVALNGRDRERERLRKREGERRELHGVPLIDLMRMTYAEWDEWTRGTAMRRAGYAGFKRNVAVALGNWGAPEAVPVLAEALSDPEPLVRAHAAWALGEIGSPNAYAALRASAAAEGDPFVVEELRVALNLLRPNGK